MRKVYEHEKEYRFGDSGPKYLMRGPKMSMGVVRLKPGESFKSHYHNIMEESFYVLEGKIDIFIDDVKHVCEKGTLITAEPGENHFLINSYEEPFQAVFMLAPFQESDKVEVN